MTNWKYGNPATFEEHSAIAAALRQAREAFMTLLGYKRFMREKDMKRIITAINNIDDTRQYMDARMFDECEIVPVFGPYYPPDDEYYTRRRDEGDGGGNVAG